MSNENDPWAIRRIDENGVRYYLVGLHYWHHDIRFARRFVHRDNAAMKLAKYLKKWPAQYKELSIIHLVKKAGDGR